MPPDLVPFSAVCTSFMFFVVLSAIGHRLGADRFSDRLGANSSTGKKSDFFVIIDNSRTWFRVVLLSPSARKANYKGVNLAKMLSVIFAIPEK